MGGQIIRFKDFWSELIKKCKDFKIIFCPYITTEFAIRRIRQMLLFYGERKILDDTERIEIKPQLIIPDNLRVVNRTNSSSEIRGIDTTLADNIAELCKNYYKYYKETNSDKVGGGCMYGFGQRGLGIVRFNNVPNQSIFLIWAELTLKEWNPLFPRRSRHNK